MSESPQCLLRHFLGGILICASLVSTIVYVGLVVVHFVAGYQLFRFSGLRVVWEIASGWAMLTYLLVVTLLPLFFAKSAKVSSIGDLGKWGRGNA